MITTAIIYNIGRGLCFTQAKKENGDVKSKQDKTTVKEKTQAPPKSKQQTDTPVEEIKKPRQKKQIF